MPVKTRAQSRNMSLDCFILIVLSWRLVNVCHSAKLSTLFRIGRDDRNDRLISDHCPKGVISNKVTKEIYKA